MNPSSEGMIPVPGGRVWYRIVGKDAPGVPLLVLHGGPGAPHDYLENLAARGLRISYGGLQGRYAATQFRLNQVRLPKIGLSRYYSFHFISGVIKHESNNELATSRPADRKPDNNDGTAVLRRQRR